MSEQSFSSEYEIALERSDIADLQRQVEVNYQHFKNGFHEETDEHSEDIDAVLALHTIDQDKAIAFLALSIESIDDPEYIAFLGAGLLENLLHAPRDEILARIVAEARKSPRFRWLASVPYKIAIADRSWDALEALRLTPGNSEPELETLPPRSYN